MANGFGIQPGTIWPAEPVTPDVLSDQWAVELHHHACDLNLAELVFTDADWADWEWNARECLHLNGQWKTVPQAFKQLFLPQNDINLHLMRSLQKLVAGWQQWIHLPQVKGSKGLPPFQECMFLLLSAWGRLESAQMKYDSLLSRKKALQTVSLRQHRFFQHLAALFADLDPLVQGAYNYAISLEPARRELSNIKKDVQWHAKELLHLVGHLDRRPGLAQRMNTPRLEINLLLAHNSLFHARFLRDLVSISTV